MKYDMIDLILDKSEENNDRFQKIYNLVYEDLKKMAHRVKFNWRHAETLNTTALVHESYLKVLSSNRISPVDKLHFYHTCGKAMRYVLLDYVEKKHAEKRMACLTEISNHSYIQNPEPVDSLVDLEAVMYGLKQLEHEDDQVAKIVECRFFSDLTIEETAQVLSISVATVKRKWKFARAYLSKEIKKYA